MLLVSHVKAVSIFFCDYGSNTNPVSFKISKTHAAVAQSFGCNTEFDFHALCSFCCCWGKKGAFSDFQWSNSLRVNNVNTCSF